MCRGPLYYISSFNYEFDTTPFDYMFRVAEKKIDTMKNYLDEKNCR